MDHAPGLRERKRKLREEILNRLRRISPGQREAASAAACALLRGQPVWKSARRILFYAPLPLEIDLRPLMFEALREGRQVALPRFLPSERAYGACQITDHDTDCVPGRFGIQEPKEHCPPAPLNQLDLLLVPGVGFALDGHRLGRGRGYFDRLLHRVTAVKCGVGFDEQVVEEVPVEIHDVVMDCMLTPTRWREIGPQRPVFE
jgi:5-formyltetrahydrofolate cyclo-ligase